MSTRRTRPRQRSNHRPKALSVVAALVVVSAVVALLVLGSSVLGGRVLGERGQRAVADSAEGTSASAAASVSAQGAAGGAEETSAILASVSGGAAVEVPALMGIPLDEARLMLAAVGLTVEVTESGAPLGKGGVQSVVAQRPGQGTRLGVGETVVLSVRPKAGVSSSAAAKRWVVCIDPGHQARSDQSQEPVGPGSTTMKQKITAGVTGVETSVPESEITLQIAVNLKQRLEDLGVRVVMTRTTNDVNVSNRERALIANKAKADLFVRVHAQGSPDQELAGVTTVYPADNRWTKPFAVRSKRAAAEVHRGVLAATGAPDLGMSPRSDIAGFNWSKVPVILVGCGYLTNPVEDRLLASPHYQDKLATGIADGVLAHLMAEGN